MEPKTRELRPDGAERRVLLHVGAPKSGTTYVQDRLTRNAWRLRRHGVHVPNLFPSLTPARAQFRAAIDLLGQDWGGPRGHAAGHWERLVGAVRRLSGTVVISHETLAPAPPEVIAKALGDLGEEAEVHVVYSARDLGRALTSAWQESVKTGRRWHLRKFLDLAEARRNWFSRALDLPEVLGAWGSGLPPERVHLVTVPAGDHDGAALWERFCEVLGVSPGVAPRPAKRTNPSLDAVATELVRRLNVRTGTDANADPNRDRYVDALLGLLEARRSQPIPIELPPQDLPWVTERARGWADWVVDRSISVHGDVRDLLPAARAQEEAWVDPDRLPRRVVLDLALDVLHERSAVKRDRAAIPDRIVTAVRRRL